MIILYNPKATKYRNRRFPLSILSMAAALEGRQEYAIVDGNLDPNATETLLALIREKRVELLAVTVMPGPQTVSAVESCREVRGRYPEDSDCLGRLFSLQLYRGGPQCSLR